MSKVDSIDSIQLTSGAVTGSSNMSAAELLQAALRRKISSYKPAEPPVEQPVEPVNSSQPQVPVQDSILTVNRTAGRPPGTITPKPTTLPPYPALINAHIDPSAAIDDLLAYLGSIDAPMLGFWLSEYHRHVLLLQFRDLLDKSGNPTVQDIVAKTGQSYQNVYMVMSGKGAIGLDRLNTILGALGYGIKPVIVPLGEIAHDRVMAELGMLDYKGEVK